MSNIVKKRFNIQIENAGDRISKTFEVDKTITAIKGVLVTSDRDDLLYYRGSQKIEINREEFFPEDYESKLLMSGINVPPNERYYDLGNVSPGNGTIKVDYIDTENTQTQFSQYRVSYYFDCIIESKS